MPTLLRAVVFLTQLLLWSLAASSAGVVGGIIYVHYLFKYADYDPGAPLLNWIAYGGVFGLGMFLIGFMSRLLFLIPALRGYTKFGAIAWSLVALPCLIYLAILVRYVSSVPH